MGWNVPNVIRMLGMLGYQPGKGKSENLYQKVIDQKVYAVDVKGESIFMFVDGERITESSDETFQALKDSVEYASVESSERRDVEEKPSTTEENPEQPANNPETPKEDKPVETPKPAQRSTPPARRQPAHSTVVVQGYTSEQIETIKNTVAKGSTDSELQMFLYVANKYGLDPFLKEIFYSDKMHTIITSRDGYLKAAQRDPAFDGIQSMAVCENDEFSIDAEKGTVMHSFGKGSRGKVIGAWAICRHVDRRPVISYASYEEYQKNNDIWRTYKSAMCCKVAEVFALKRQFGISGLVTTEELGVEVV